MKLVIVESPTKAKTISKFLGKSFHVLSSFGHIRDLPKSKLGVDVENNFEPQYVIPTRAKKNLTALKKEAKKAEEVILATDEDREGEAIAWHLAHALELDDKNAKRIVFHEITKSAIESAVENPRKLDMHLVDAQQARRILDRLVGYKLSPFLWQKVARGLSAGRVQSVSVRLIVEREAEREAFKKEEYWTIESNLNANDTIFKGELISIGNKTLEKFSITTEENAKKILEDLENATASVNSVEKRIQEKHAPTPFTTSSLQQTAAQRLHFSPKQTMMFAQHLYEEGHITYMRTDSVNVAESALLAATSWIKTELGNKYTLPKPRVFKTKSKGAQEAHEAIRPTNPSITPGSITGKIGEQENRLYELIWQRFIASQLPNAEVKQTRIDIDARGKNDTYVFRANGASLAFDGFMKIYPMTFTENILPELSKDSSVTIQEIIPLQHFTEPPPRYSEATLVKALEKFGIGRPSTYAPTISTIQERGYIEKDDQRKLAPTETAKIVNNILVEHFPHIVDISFTAEMEEQLDDIAEGKLEWEPVIKAFYEPFAENLEKKYDSVASQKVEEKTGELCEKCGKEMVIKRGRFGKFMACSGFPDCKTTKRIPDPELDMKCPTCKEGDVLKRRSKKGRTFYGCSRYPDCDFVSWKKPEEEKKEEEIKEIDLEEEKDEEQE